MSTRSDLWIYLLIFVLISTAARFAQLAISKLAQLDRRTTMRFASLDREDKIAQAIDILRKKELGAGLVLISRLRLLVMQSGVAITFQRACLIAAVIALIFAFILPIPGSVLVRLPASGLASIVIVTLYFSNKRTRRIERFGEQLPDVIDVIVRSLRAGHPLPVALALVAREMPEPAGSEFSTVVDEITYGRDISGALEQLEKRIGYRELRFLVASITISQQTGGNLSEILARLARMLRERFRLKRKVLALSAEGRFSGYALTSLPLFLFGLIHLVSATYYADFWSSPSRSTILAVAGGLLLIGNYVIYKMVHFKV